MRRGLTPAVWLCALGALTSAGLASAAGEGPANIEVGWGLFSADGGVEPKSVSRTEFDPMRMNLEGRISSVDGSPPPALNELIVAMDKSLKVDATGIPTCNGGGRRPRDPEAIEAACGPAIIGEGEITVEAAFPEITPITLTSKLLLINAGVSGGTTTWYLYAFFNAPLTQEIFSPVEIRKHRDGRYGTRATVTIPKLGGGFASVRNFWLTVAKNVKGEAGKTYHPIAGRCADGKIQLGVEARFADGERQPVEIVRACNRNS